VTPGPHNLPPLPYLDSGLAEVISTSTRSFRYRKHHQGYVDNLNELVVGAAPADLSPEKDIAETAGTADKIAVFNHAAQTGTTRSAGIV
jgi:superoxide dismutase, Fe-Mn family